MNNEEVFVASDLKVNLWISLDNVSRLALSIPLTECNKFSVNPLKWLRFLGFTIYGHEGYLSTFEAGPEIDDYTAVIQACSYYYISDYEPCLVDVNAADERTTSISNMTRVSNMSVHRADFRRRVIERDGTCVITGDPAPQCVACHIIPHSKGDDYLTNISNLRGGTGTNHIVHINDTQNGILMHIGLQSAIATADSAFLKTPNFAMTVDDVPYLQQRQANEQWPSSRLTVQHFAGIDILGHIINHCMPHNSDVRQPQDTTEWPPAIIVDLFYGSVALNTWGSRDFIELVREKSRDAYYHDAEGDGIDGPQMGSDDVEGGGQDNYDSQLGYQTARHSNRYPSRHRNNLQVAQYPKENSINDLMDGILALWMQHSKKTKSKQESTNASDKTRNSEKINEWLRSI